MSDGKLQSLGSLGSKAKQIVDNVAKYFLQESKKETSPASYKRRTVEATGVSRTTVFKIRKEQMDMGVLRSPKRSGRGPYKPDDDFDQTVIRNKIQVFYIVRRQLSTLKSLHEALKKRENRNPFRSRTHDHKISKTTHYLSANLCLLAAMLSNTNKYFVLSIQFPLRIYGSVRSSMQSTGLIFTSYTSFYSLFVRLYTK